MPTSITEHVIYTRNEINNLPYYKEIFNVLKNENIESFLDIGANTGEYARCVYEYIPTLKKSYLIEPEDNNFKFMEKHVYSLTNCKIYKLAIGYGATRGNIQKSSNTGGHTIQKVSDGGDTTVKNLESLHIPLVDFVKIDIEGMEYEIIQNSQYLKKVKWLDIEFHQTPEQLKNHFVKNFILENLPTFDIIVYQKDGLNDYGRCLLKNRL